MPVQQSCPTCGGSGSITLGMSFEEAVSLAETLAASGLFRLRALETVSDYPNSWDIAWTVRAGHMLSGGTNVTFKGPEFDPDYWRIWSPISHPER